MTSASSSASERPLVIVAGYRKESRCPNCRRAIVYVASSPKGKLVPFDTNPLVLERRQDPTTFVRFEVVSRTNIHFATCLAPRATAPASGARERRG